MPTGYTYKIVEGQKFEDFIMGCAKAFGACISLRDEPSDTPIPEKFEESGHEKKEYEKAVLELEKYENMTVDEANKKSEKEYKESEKSYRKYLNRVDEKEKLYVSMLEEVNKWEPPSEDHVELKNFMKDQIDISMDKGLTRKYNSKVIRLSGEQWRFKKIKELTDDVEYYMKKWNEETERIANNNEWIKKLRESIK